MNTLDAALRLSLKYPVFPCRGSNKAPSCPRGFKDATRDAETIVDLWRRFPGELIGVPTGLASGVDALDIDPRHGGDTWLTEAADSLPVTQINHTRSGGRHFLFRHADKVRNSAGKIAPGVDVRGEGGYIVWWPAHGCRPENIGVIEAWPRWLYKLICPAPIKRAPPPIPATKAEADTRAALMIERAFERVREAQPGQRHYQLRAAAATIGGLARFISKSDTEIERELVDLIMSTGAESRTTAEKTAHWAMQKGERSPLLFRR